METVVDCELLISVIFERPPIWDKTHKAHSNRKLVERLWREVSATMAVEEVILRKKWKYLRDQFAVEIGKSPSRLGENGENEPTSKWPYFKQLLFLKDIVKPRMTSGNFANLRAALTTNTPLEFLGLQSYMDVEDITCEPEIKIEEMRVKEEDEIIDHLPVDHGETYEQKTSVKCILFGSGTSSNKRKKLSHFDDEQQLVLKEQELLSQINDKKSKIEEDEDLLFFKSLLPHVKSIPLENKLTFRRRILEVVDSFAYEAHQRCAPTPLFININSVSSNSTIVSSDGVNTEDRENSNN